MQMHPFNEIIRRFSRFENVEAVALLVGQQPSRLCAPPAFIVAFTMGKNNPFCALITATADFLLGIRGWSLKADGAA